MMLSRFACGCTSKQKIRSCKKHGKQLTSWICTGCDQTGKSRYGRDEHKKRCRFVTNELNNNNNSLIEENNSCNNTQHQFKTKPIWPVEASEQENVVISGKQYLNLLNNSICFECERGKCCVYDTKEINGAIKANVKCSVGCFFSMWSSPPKQQSGRPIAEVLHKSIEGASASGLSFTEWSSLLASLGLKPPTEKCFANHQKSFFNKASAAADTIIFNSLETEAKLSIYKTIPLRHGFTLLPFNCVLVIYKYLHTGISLEIGIDGAWDSRRNGLNHTFTVVGLYSHSVIGRKNINRTNKSNTNGYTGPSKNMESIGLKRWLEDIKLTRLFEMNIEVGWFVHDKDTSATKIIQQEFPLAKELQDLNHLVVRFRKKIREKIKGFGALCGRCLEKSIHSSSSEEEVEKKIKAYPYHIIGDHSYCTSGCRGGEPIKRIPNKTFNTLKDEFKNVIPDAVAVSKNASTNMNESINSSYSKLRPKKYHFGGTNNGRVDLSIVKRKEGIQAIKHLCDKPSRTFEEHLDSVGRKRKRRYEIFNTPEHRNKRRKWRQELKEIHKEDDIPEYEYKNMKASAKKSKNSTGNTKGSLGDSLEGENNHSQVTKEYIFGSRVPTWQQLADQFRKAYETDS